MIGQRFYCGCHISIHALREEGDLLPAFFSACAA